MSTAKTTLLTVLLISLFCSGLAQAASQGTTLPGPAEPPAGWSYLSLGRNFDRLTADWREPYTGFKTFGESDRSGMGMEGSLGAYLALARHYDPQLKRAWQVGLEGGFFALFDWSGGGSLQSRATDYRVAASLSYSQRPWQWKLSVGHLSSHPGDYHLRNEDPATKTIYWEDLKAMIGWTAVDWLRLYAGGTLYLTHRDRAGSADLQTGLELSRPFPSSPLAAYAALDLQFKDRNDYNATISAEGGLKILGFGGQLGCRVYAFILDGPDPAGVFSAKKVTRYGLGLSFDY